MHKVSNSNVIFQDDKLGNVPELAGTPLGSRRLSIDEESQFGLKMMEKKKNPRIESIPWQIETFRDEPLVALEESPMPYRKEKHKRKKL